MPEIDLVALVLTLLATVTMPVVVLLLQLRWEEEYKREYLRASEVWKLKSDRFDALLSQLYDLVDIATFRGEVKDVEVAADARSQFGTILAHALDLIHSHPELCQAYRLPENVKIVLDTPLENQADRARHLEGLKGIAMVVSQRVLIRGCEEIQTSRGRLVLFLEDAQISDEAQEVMMACWRRFHGNPPEANLAREDFTTQFRNSMMELQRRMRLELDKTLAIPGSEQEPQPPVVDPTDAGDWPAARPIERRP